MSELQCEMPLASAQPERGPELAERLVALLESRPCWLTRKDLNRILGFSADGRDARLARQYAKGRIIYGQNGYKAARHATRDEMNCCYNTLRSQAAVLMTEAVQLYRHWVRGDIAQEQMRTVQLESVPEEIVAEDVAAQRALAGTEQHNPSHEEIGK